MALYQLVYISQATKPFDDESLDALLTQAKENNAKRQITGSLIYNGGLFLQVLEGEQEDIERLFNKIASDPRHFKVRRLYFEPAKRRLFSKWSMNLVDLVFENPNKIQLFYEIIEALDKKSSEDGIPAPLKLLQVFSYSDDKSHEGWISDHANC